MIKRLLLAIVFLAIVVGGLVGFNLFRSKMIADFFANMPQKTMTVSTITVEPAVWTPGLEAIGSVNASEGVDLTFEVAGVVDKIKFKANEKVQKGQVLVQLDDSIQVADLAAAKASAVLSDQNLKRAQTLRTQGVGAVSNVDSASASSESARAQVAKLEAVLKQKTLIAPFTGTMGISKVDVGQYVTPGLAIATLQNMDTMRVDFTVTEQSINLLKLGQTIHIYPTKGEEFTGKITGIDPKIDPSTRLVSVRGEIENVNGQLNPGQFVQVSVQLPEEGNIIAVPQTAVVSSLYGDYVFVVRPVKTEGAAADADVKETLAVDQVFVQLGRKVKGVVEITKGIQDGDIIVSAGQNRLSPKMHVVIDNTVNPANPATAQ
ncbi:efflux RND transporter periplasmic adaptor subunit [Paenochrobactrum glaciei]|uniref:Efflux RND transporter periplasmic adaptor subunit n=1 Tax=Paenochrobactrum glaciei TaxID=486407 RepID=A0ABN1G2B6_9HYPH